MRVSNEDRLPVGIDGEDAAPTPTGFAEIVCDDFPILHAAHSAVFALHTATTNDTK